ncbi:ZN574 protein, partial [Bucorvus abyssinicus]|nr:ZN574 protein [Bucorvus abyssinicus]
RYVCSECNHLASSLEDALLHQQHHFRPPAPHQHHHHQYEVVGLAGDYQALAVPETSQYQCLECGQLLVSPGQLLEHQEMHIKLLGQDQETPPGVKAAPAGAPGGGTGAAGVSGAIHYECLECKALFASQELWLSHRQSHRGGAPEPPAQRVDLEHSYRKPGEEEEEEREEEQEEAGGGAAALEDDGAGGTVQLLLYECGECLQLFPSPSDFLQHQAVHLAAPAAADSGTGGTRQGVAAAPDGGGTHEGLVAPNGVIAQEGLVAPN